MADQLAELFVKFKVEGDEFKTALKDMGMEIGETEKKTGLLESAFSKLGAQIVAAFGVYKLYGYAKDILEVGIAFDSMKTSMEVSTGSAMAAASAMAFLKNESERLGLVYLDNVKSFQSLAAAASTSSLTMEQTRQIWTGVATAGSALKLSTDQMNGAFLALQQMISKGTVSAEEMRQQLGERLPGAFALAAQAMGMTTMEFGKAMEQGKILADEFLPKLAAKLIETFGEGAVKAANSAQAAINNYNNALNDLKINLAEQVLPLFVDMLNKATEFLKSVAPLDEATAIANRLATIETAIQNIEKQYGTSSKAIKALFYDQQIANLEDEKIRLITRLDEIKANAETEQLVSAQTLEVIQGLKATEAAEDVALREATVDKKIDQLAIGLAAEKEMYTKIYGELEGIVTEKEEKALQAAIDAIAKREAALEKAAADDAARLLKEQAAIDKANAEYEAGLAKKLAADLKWQAEAEAYNQAHLDRILAAAQAAEREKLLATGTFFDGVKLGLADLEKKQLTWAQAGVKAVTDLATASRNTMSDLFFDAMSGDLKSFGDYWDAFWNSMKRTTADILAQMATQNLQVLISGFFNPAKQAASGWGTEFSGIIGQAFEGIGDTISGYGGSLISAISSLGSSLASALGGLFSFHQGSWLVPGDMLAILQEGEMVIPKQLSTMIRPLLEAIAGVPNLGSVLDTLSGIINTFDSNFIGASIEKFAGYTSTDYGSILGGMDWMNTGDVSGLMSGLVDDVTSGAFGLPGGLGSAASSIGSVITSLIDYFSMGSIGEAITTAAFTGGGTAIGTVLGLGPIGGIIGNIIGKYLASAMTRPPQYTLWELEGYQPDDWVTGRGLVGGSVIQPSDWYSSIAYGWTYGLSEVAKDLSSRILALLKYTPNGSSVESSLDKYPYWSFMWPGSYDVPSAGTQIPQMVESMANFYWSVWNAASTGKSLPIPASLQPPGYADLLPGNYWIMSDWLGAVGEHVVDLYTGKWVQLPIGQSFDYSLAGYSPTTLSMEPGSVGGYSKGTGLGGLPRTGSYYGHAGEIVLNPSESALVRSGASGGGGGTTHIHVEIDGKELMRLLVRNADKSPEWSSSIGRIVRRYAH